MTGVAQRFLRCAALLTETGWRDDVAVGLDGAGCITEICAAKDLASGAAASTAGAAKIEDLGGFVMPGFQNAHSHAFQYAMAGLAEHLPAGAEADDFWSWRDAMYQLALRISPDDMQAVATMLYCEMLRHGYTSVVEFHYLHHDCDGKPYGQLAEMGTRLMAAAADAGIQLTLLPVFYQQGGFDKAATASQRRFLSATRDDFAKLLEATRAAAVAAADGSKSDVVVGLAVHSLRAVRTDDAVATLALKGFNGPRHLHIAEQRREVDDCVAHLGQRPVAWLMEHLEFDAGLHLVHATHMTPEECARVATSGAGVVICPSTEGNLGDGFFALAAYHAAGGRYAIGTDSHIGLNPLEELRWLDYGQRMRLERRNVLCRKGEDSAQVIFDAAWRGGRRAAGRPAEAYFAVGDSFDAVVVNPEHPALLGKPAARRLAALIYAGDSGAYKGVLRRGQWLVQDGRHRGFDKALSAFKRVQR